MKYKAGDIIKFTHSDEMYSIGVIHKTGDLFSVKWLVRPYSARYKNAFGFTIFDGNFYLSPANSWLENASNKIEIVGNMSDVLNKYMDSLDKT